MMEAIKLFLEVEGCAFVLALDDEVVERGILHRYRDYLFQWQEHQRGHGVNPDGESPATYASPPITGAEYLEKMIHLPVRLPQPTEHQAVPVSTPVMSPWGSIRINWDSRSCGAISAWWMSPRSMEG